jgi:putative ABC transport system permease protein
MSDLSDILAALRRNGVGAILIAAQIALTVMIVCNSLSIIQQRLERTKRGSGIDEANIFTLDNRWVGPQSERPARREADLTALRSLPGVIDATATYNIPLRGGGENGWVTLVPDQQPVTAWNATYYLDDHALNAFGTRLEAGRWFTADDLGFVPSPERKFPDVAVVTRSLANALFPAGDALGKSFYYSNFPMRIIGIVDRLEGSFMPLGFGEAFFENSLVVPGYMQFTDDQTYVVRTRPGERDAVMSIAAKTLLNVNRARIIKSVQTFADVRSDAYRGARGLSLMLGTVSALLIVVTALGIVGLTSYWVNQRKRQIGVRRALGAGRTDILRYFHVENLLIAGCGAVAGVLMALILNAHITHGLQVTPMSPTFAVTGAVILFALSQAAVFWPAWRAASLPPAIAARGA